MQMAINCPTPLCAPLSWAGTVTQPSNTSAFPYWPITDTFLISITDGGIMDGPALSTRMRLNSLWGSSDVLNRTTSLTESY